MNYWDRLRNYLQQKVSVEGFDNWLKGTAQVGQEGDTLYVSVPDRETRSWLETEYASSSCTGIAEMGLAVRRVSYETLAATRPASHGRPPVSNGSSEAEASSSALNPKFTFDSFVVGACNQFAHAAAKSVATNPSRSYNPLFLYGGVGMGKTHLMHAIGRELIDRHGAMRIIYTSSERFMNEMISCIRTSACSSFTSATARPTSCSIDDIQLLGNKERTQEEFFHTFNELHDHQKQIVISSDSPPKDIPACSSGCARASSGACWPTSSRRTWKPRWRSCTRRRRWKASSCPTTSAPSWPRKTKSNVRELEGALVKLIAYSSLTGTPINLQMAQQVLKHLVHVQDRRVTIDAIQKAVAEKFQVKQIASSRKRARRKKVVYPRQVAMYLVKELTNASLPEIGRAFGGKHHTTVIHSINKIEKDRHTEAELNRLLHSLMDSLQ